MPLILIILIALVLIAVFCLPTYGYSRSWGYGPTGILWFIVIVILILWLLGVLG